MKIALDDDVNKKASTTDFGSDLGCLGAPPIADFRAKMCEKTQMLRKRAEFPPKTGG